MQTAFELGIPAVAAGALLIGSRAVLRDALRDAVPQRRPHAARPSHARPPRGQEPPPISGAASGLLESIPYLEAARTGRIRGTAKLVVTISVLAALFAAALFAFGRALATWISSLSSL